MNGGYTWFHGHSKSKLDRIFVDTKWMLKFPDLKSSLLNRLISDHCPLLASSIDQNWGPRPFRFINIWLSNPRCMEIIQISWFDSKGLEPHKRLKALKMNLREWSKSNFGHIDSTISKLEEKIANFDATSNFRSLDESDILERKSCQLDLWKWLEKRVSLGSKVMCPVAS